MPIAPGLSTIREAQALLRNCLDVTPVVQARSLARAGAEAWLKIETGLPTGSFKPRGALFGLACALKRQRVEEVTACSTGNHGAAVAFAAKILGVRATIFLPENPNRVKRTQPCHVSDGKRGLWPVPQVYNSLHTHPCSAYRIGRLNAAVRPGCS